MVLKYRVSETARAAGHPSALDEPLREFRVREVQFFEQIVLAMVGVSLVSLGGRAHASNLQQALICHRSFWTEHLQSMYPAKYPFADDRLASFWAEPSVTGRQ